MLDNHEDEEEKPQKKRRKLSVNQANKNQENSNGQDMNSIKVCMSQIYFIKFSPTLKNKFKSAVQDAYCMCRLLQRLEW